MSKKIYLLFLLSLTLAFTACSETEEVGRYDNWEARGVAFMDSIANVYAGQKSGAIKVTDPKDSLYAILDESTRQTIYVKKIINVTSGESPKFTSTISAYYRMSYFNGDVVKQTFTGSEPIDDSSSKVEFNLASEISGWSYALIHMKVGDYWTLYIPQQSGYGSGTGQDGSLEPYSALIYNVKLAEIVVP